MIRWTHLRLLGKPAYGWGYKEKSRAQKTAETELELCSNHNQSPSCYWPFSIMPTNIFLTVDIFFSPKSSLLICLDGICVWNQVFLALETDNIFICSFSSSFDFYRSNHTSFSSHEDFVMHFILWVSGWKPSLCWGLTWSSYWLWANYSPCKPLLFCL